MPPDRSRGPPGCRVSSGVASQGAGIEELVERLGRIFLGVAIPGVVPGNRVPPGETGREERVSSEHVQTVLDRMARAAGQVRRLDGGGGPARLVPDIGSGSGCQ